jgi:quercetin dioxygenase-like cupin family protein
MNNIPDVLKIKNNGYKLLLENDKVRVMEIRLEPGQKSPMHNHPDEHVVYVNNDAKFRLSFPDGKSSEFELKAGQAFFMESGPHETENVGRSKGHNIVIELKK